MTSSSPTTISATNPAKIGRLPLKMGNDPRTRYYAKLGIFPPSPSVEGCKRPQPLSEQSPRPLGGPTSPPCLRHKRSVLHSTPAKERRVSWNQNVKLYRIPSHEDYSNEEWNNMWIDQETLDYEKDRSTFEFTFDGTDWRNATEEDGFQEAADGTLVHPATWLAYRHHWERYGPTAPLNVNFRALIDQARAAKPSWSPRPVKQRKSTFWLFDLALQSVQKGKNAMHNQRATPSLGITNQYKPHRADRGYP